MEALQTTSVLSQALSVASPSANIAPSTAGAVPGVPSRAHGSAINSDGANIMIGIACMLLVLCMAAVGGRLLARRRAKLRLEADDYLALVALSLMAGLSIEQILLAMQGRSMIRSPSLRKARSIEQLHLASQLTYAFLMTTAKLCVLLLYRRIFSLRVRWFRVAWWINTVVAILIGLALLIIGLAQCAPRPPSQAWHQLGSCQKDPPSMALMGFLNAATDLLILMLPIRMCWKLQMSRKRKLGVLFVFGLGLIAVAVSIARAVAIATGSISIENGALNFIIWSTTEPAVALICACLPITRKLLATGVSKICSYTGISWLYFGRSHSNEPLRKLRLITTSHHVIKDDNSFHISPQSTNISREGSHNEWLITSSDIVRGEKPQPHSLYHHHIKPIASVDPKSKSKSLPFPLRDLNHRVKAPDPNPDPEKEGYFPESPQERVRVVSV